jgi:hypothetical protein
MTNVAVDMLVLCGDRTLFAMPRNDSIEEPLNEASLINKADVA